MDDLQHQQDWTHKIVELGVIGGVALGLGALAVKGTPNDYKRYGSLIANQVDKSLNKTIKGHDRKLIWLYQAVKQLPRTLKGQKMLQTPEELQAAMRNVDPKKVKEEAIRRFDNQYKRELFEFHKKNPGKPFVFGKKPQEFEVDVNTEHNEKVLNGKKSPFSPGQTDKKEDKTFGQKLGDNFLTSTISGLGIGAGVTAFHALDRKIRKKDDKKAERSFNAAGSFFKSNSPSLNKAAGYREMHDYLVDTAHKMPQSIASGLGLTAVSLGAAKALRLDQAQNNSQDNHPIVISLNTPQPRRRPAHPAPPKQKKDEKKDDSYSQTTLGGLRLSPKLLNVPGPNYLMTKSGSWQDGIKGFVKNVGGRSAEQRQLQRKIDGHAGDYKTQALDQLKHRNDLNEELKERFGNVKMSEEDKHRDLVEHYTHELQQSDRDELEKIRNAVALSRMQFGGGLIGGGLALHGVSQLTKPKDEAYD